ncbi:hypothetical protein [Pseudomonas sp. AE27]|uniref:P-loop NTPase n=1 Tax=Pseudomonas sp. AE27 TaxID=3127460 RepID=UPI0030CFE2B3
MFDTIESRHTPEKLITDILDEERPLVLFLGQSFCSDSKGDPLVRKALEHLRKTIPNKSTWPKLITTPELKKSTYEWLSERFERNVLSESLSMTFEVAWSAVFTSSIDPQISRKLESKGRAPETIVSKEHFARVARSRSRPPVHYLFGKSNELEGNYSVPCGPLELIQRKSIHTNALVSRISETVTSLGLLVVEGFIPEDDWLTADELLAPISTNESITVLWLGQAPNNSMVFDLLLEKGQIRTDSRRLHEILTHLLIESDKTTEAQLGLIEQRASNTITLDNGRYLQVTPSLRLRVEAAAAIIDDSWLEDAPPLLGAALEEDFRKFHGGFGGVRTQVDGVRKGYAIKRDFETALERAFRNCVRHLGKQQNFIVLHGQSGTGKTVALARLAYQLRSETKIPVLYAKNRIPNASDIEEFIAEAERSGATCVAVICDANQAPDRYRDLANSLKSRGRKCITIGSSYKVEGIKRTNRGFVEAEAEATQKEVSALSSLLKRYAPRQSVRIEHEKNVFALLYRYISMGRARIIDGIAEEARHAELVVRIRAKSIPYTNKPEYVLAKQLISLGLGKENTSIFEDELPEHAEAGLDAAGKLIDLVMASGRLDCPIPLNLLLRALSGTSQSLDYTQISYLFESLDLFRWHTSDAEGNEFLIQPRLRLEAELICRRRLAEKSKEIECLLQLMKAVRRSAPDSRSEVAFLLDLLGKMQKEGPRKKAYESGYLSVAKTLTELREVHQVKDASLMLQESVFRRAAVQSSDNSDPHGANSLTVEQRAEILNEAREIVETARNEIDERSMRASKKTRANLAVEHASIYGYLAVGLARQGADEEIVWSHYLAARTATATAISEANNHYPYDIALWTPVDILKYSKSSLAHEMELKADVFSIFDHANTENFNDFSASKFKERKIRAAEDLGSFELADEAYLSLEKTHPAVAYYLKARTTCRELFHTKTDEIKRTALAKVPSAINFLRSKLDIVQTDIRPLQLLIQLIWVEKTGRFIFGKEKALIPNDRRFQEEMLTLVRSLNALAGDNQKNNFRLLEAVFEWVSGSVEQAIDLFKELSSDTEFEDSARVVRRFLLESSGPHSGFRGRVIRDRGDGHWTVNIYNISKNIDLLGRDFIREELAVGREISNFNISFNYLGPIAEPLSRHGVRS